MSVGISFDSVRILLEFTGDGGQLRLCRGTARNDEAPAERNQAEIRDGMAKGSGQTNVFQWRPAVRAFCILVLEGLLRGKPYQANLTGGPRTPASSLAEILGDKSAKGGGKTWIQNLFSPFIKPDWGDRRVPHGILLPKTNSATKFFSVALGAAWCDAEIELEYEGKPVTTANAEVLLATLKGQLNTGGKPKANPRLAATIDLLVWEPRLRQLLPAEESNFPLPVSSGIAVRVRLTRPAYLYVLWINSQQKVQPLFPWKDFNWAAPAAGSPVAELALPHAQLRQDAGYYPFQALPGVETALLLASDSPVPARTLLLLKKSFPRCRLSLPDPARIYTLVDLRPNSEGSQNFRLGTPRAFDDPLSPLRDAILGLVGRDFPCIAGVSFSTKKIS